jgi:hypothetical protein
MRRLLTGYVLERYQAWQMGIIGPTFLFYWFFVTDFDPYACVFQAG